MTERRTSNEQHSLGLKFQDYVKTIDPQVFGVGEVQRVSCTPLDGGHSNVTYLTKVNGDKPFVLRFYPGANGENDRTAEEYRKLRQAEGIHAPKALHLGKPDFVDSSVLIMEFVQGEHKDFNDLSPVEVRSFARAVADIHNITREGVFSKTPDFPEDVTGTHYDYLQSYRDNNLTNRLTDADPAIFAKDKAVIDHAQEKLTREMEQHKDAFAGTTFSYSHNDIVALNVLWDNNEPTLIDWEVPSYGDRADEVAFLFAINNTSPQFQEQFLGEYEKHVDDPTLRERVNVYVLKNRLFDLAWSVTMLDEESSKNPLMKKEEGLYQKFYEDRLRGLKECLGVEA